MWDRLRNPNGQAARTLWKEGTRPNARRSRNINVRSFRPPSLQPMTEPRTIILILASHQQQHIFRRGAVPLSTPDVRWRRWCRDPRYCVSTLHQTEISLRLTMHALVWGVSLLGSAALQVIPAKSIPAIVVLYCTTVCFAKQRFC
jgi:hypothetical protein